MRQLVSRYLALFSFSKKYRIQVRRWVLLKGNRWLIASGLVAIVFVLSLALSVTDAVGLRQKSFVTTLFSTVIAGILSLVPIIVAVNQLTVSQLFASPSGLRERIESVQELRTEIEQMLPRNPVSPTEPAQFLSNVIRLVASQSTALHQACTDTENEHMIERIEDYIDTIITQTEDINAQLVEENPPLIAVLVPMMGQGYSKNVNTTRQLQDEHGDALSESANELLNDLRELFVTLDVIRQYFKALYLHQALSHVSRLITYSGTVVFLVSVFLIMIFTNGPPFPGHPLLVQGVICFGLAVAFSPLAILLAFMIRISTIAKRTAAPGAFTPRKETPDHLQ